MQGATREILCVTTGASSGPARSTGVTHITANANHAVLSLPAVWEKNMLNTQLKPATTGRVLRSLGLRTGTAGIDALVPSPPQIDNGDEARYGDKSGTYTKGVL